MLVTPRFPTVQPPDVAARRRRQVRLFERNSPSAQAIPGRDIRVFVSRRKTPSGALGLAGTRAPDRDDVLFDDGVRQELAAHGVGGGFGGGAVWRAKLDLEVLARPDAVDALEPEVT